MKDEQTKQVEQPAKQLGDAGNLNQHQANCIIKMRDAFALQDYNESYHWLYQIASPRFDKDSEEVWAEIEKIASGEEAPKAAPKGDDVKSVKDSVAVSRGYPNWLEMENWLIDHNSPATVAILLVSAMEDVASQFAAPQAVKWVQAEHEAELLELRQWKKEAMEVMPDFQKIGKLLGVPLGQSVHDKIIPGIKKLVEGSTDKNETNANRE